MSSTTRVRYPDGVTEDNVRPLAGWRRQASPLGLLVFGAIVALGLGGFLGHERTWAASSGGTDLEVHVSEVVRNGEFMEMRVRVTASAGLDELVIGIEDGLWEDVTVNTMIPAASEETNADGETRFTFGELPAETSFLFKVDMQINPDIIGGNRGRVTVYDAEAEIVATDISITVLP
jgi:hypothetical protein